MQLTNMIIRYSQPRMRTNAHVHMSLTYSSDAHHA
jgi:hypothetical protein